MKTLIFLLCAFSILTVEMSAELVVENRKGQNWGVYAGMQRDDLLTKQKANSVISTTYREGAMNVIVKGFIPILIFLFIVTGCAMIDVSSDYDQDAQFSDLKTYAWIPEWQPKVNDPRLDSTLIDTRVRTAVEKTLAGKGFQKADAATADFWISYQAAINQKLDVTTIDLPYSTPSFYGGRYTSGYSHWGGYGWKGHSTETFVTPYEQGALIVDLVNPKTKSLIWRATAKAAIDEKAAPVKREAKINQAVEKIFAKFPPQIP